MDKIEKFESEISDFAQRLLDMENSFDSSMRGHFIDTMVTSYVEKHSDKIDEMFEFILKNQKENYDTYGDYDESVTKLKVNVTPKYKDENCTATGMFIRDIFSGNDFIIIKKITEPNDVDQIMVDRLRKVEIHIRKIKGNKNFNTEFINKEPENSVIDYKDFVQYGDLRDKGYVVTFKTELFTKGKFRVESGRGMSHFYPKFKEALWVLNCVYFDLTHPEK